MVRDHLVVLFDQRAFDPYQLQISCCLLGQVAYVGVRGVEPIFLLLLLEGTVSHVLKSDK